MQGVSAARLARQVNEYAAAIRDEDPSHFGFFASLPPLLDDIDAALEEISYALDQLGADGVTLYTRYGHDNHYLGHPDFRRIWDELDARKAVVFIHPTHLVDTNLVNSSLPQPMIDYPHETTRTAVDLVVSNTVRTHTGCKIILSHAGGTLPYLATRAAYMLPDAGLSDKPAEEFLEDVRRFYYDLALSSNEYTLGLLLKFAKPTNILFGSDFPYAPLATIRTHTANLENYSASQEQVLRIPAPGLMPALEVAIHLLWEKSWDFLGYLYGVQPRLQESVLDRGIARENALELFPRFKKEQL